MPPRDIAVHVIDESPLPLEAVKNLWRAHSDTLGMFPDGAFEEHAKGRTIITATASPHACAGYLLYRRTKQHVAITHLCVGRAFRGQGIARKLLDRLIVENPGTPGILVRCRADFEANPIWPKLGFVKSGESLGRGCPRKTLVRWWLPVSERTLFSETARQLQETKIAVVVDANIVFDLVEDDEKGIPSKSLLADWLQDLIELFVTDEIDIEIDRCGSPKQKAASRRMADSFHRVHPNMARFDDLQKRLREYVRPDKGPQAESDIRQLTRTIAAGVGYFVTRDRPLLNLASRLADAYELDVLHPTDLIVHLDELHREVEYEPVRFKGSEVEVQRLKPASLEETAHIFREQGERQRHLSRYLRGALARPEEYRCFAVMADGLPTAVVVERSRIDGGPVEIPLIRIRNSPLAPTWWRQVLRDCVVRAVATHRSLVQVRDKHLNAIGKAALADLGFLKADEGWVKVNLSGLKDSFTVAEAIQCLGKHPVMRGIDCTAWADRLAIPKLDASAVVNHEHKLWPLKLADGEVPVWVVPIRPRWARELFDEQLANQQLFARRGDLAMNYESVYYRSARGGPHGGPARILWYLSEEKGQRGTKCLAACSTLHEVVVDTPKALFRRFKRLGVYEWSQVYETAGHDVNGCIMALRFTDTELFPSRIGFTRANAVLREAGEKKNQFQAPVRISNDAFVKLYEEATR